jgi:hypothetical protein
MAGPPIEESLTEINIKLRDPDNQLARLIEYIRRLSAPGHSFEVIVDPKSEDEKSFGIDGDGPFYIKEIKLNKKQLKIVDDKIVEEYLSRIDEREYTDDTERPDLFQLDRFKKLMNFDKEEDDFNDDRQSVQPTLIGLIKNVGGDYRGRDDMANMKRNDYTGLKMLKKYLPKDWNEKLKKHVARYARKDHD